MSCDLIYWKYCDREKILLKAMNSKILPTYQLRTATWHCLIQIQKSLLLALQVLVNAAQRFSRQTRSYLTGYFSRSLTRVNIKYCIFS